MGDRDRRSASRRRTKPSRGDRLVRSTADSASPSDRESASFPGTRSAVRGAARAVDCRDGDGSPNRLDLAGVRLHEPAQDLDHGRLAGAVFAEQGVHGSRRRPRTTHRRARRSRRRLFGSRWLRRRRAAGHAIDLVRTKLPAAHASRRRVGQRISFPAGRRARPGSRLPEGRRR